MALSSKGRTLVFQARNTISRFVGATKYKFMQKYEYTVLNSAKTWIPEMLNEMNRTGRWRPILVVDNQIILERPIDDVRTVDLSCISLDQLTDYIKQMTASKMPIKSSQT